MSPNEGYQRRLGEWEKKSRENREAETEIRKKGPPPPRTAVGEYEEGDFPIGCILVALSMLVGLAFFLWRLKAVGIF
jgi:hypothetical protein